MSQENLSFTQEENLFLLMSMFPQLSKEMLKAELQNNKYSVESTVEHLLLKDSQDLKDLTQTSSPVADLAENIPVGRKPTQLEEDELLAIQIQKQLQMEESNDEELAKALIYEDDDEVLARSMQMELMNTMDPYYGTGSFNYSPSEGNSFGSGISLSLQALDSNMVNEMLALIKGTMIPFMLEELKNAQIPIMKEEVDTGKLGIISFGVDGISISDAQIPPEGTTMTLEGTQLHLTIANISATLKNINWFYEKQSFPKLKDNGKGSAVISNATIFVIMNVGMDNNVPTTNVASCKMNIGQLDLKISGTKASVLYNMILSLFKNAIKSNIETALAEMVVDSINNNSTEMMDSLTTEI